MYTVLITLYINNSIKKKLIILKKLFLEFNKFIITIKFEIIFIKFIIINYT